MLKRVTAITVAVCNKAKHLQKCTKYVHYGKSLSSRLPLIDSKFTIGTLTTRPFSLSARACLRVQDIKYFPLSKEEDPSYQFLTADKRLRGRRNTKKDKLKAKLDERLQADKLETATNDAIHLIRKKLNLNETDIVKLNMNIDYLISERIPIEVISKIANNSPKSLNIDASILKQKVRAFKVNSIYEESIAKILKRNPSLLLCKLEDTLSQKVEAVRGLELNLSVLEIANILERCPDIIQYLTVDKLIDKIKFLKKKVGFTSSQLRRLLIKSPSVLTMGKDSLKEKSDFCIANFNVDLDQLSKYPRVLQCPMKRLKERYLFLKQEELLGENIKIRGWAFKTLAANSDQFFAQNIAQKPLKKFKDFQEQLQRGQENSKQKS